MLRSRRIDSPNNDNFQFNKEIPDESQIPIEPALPRSVIKKDYSNVKIYLVRVNKGGANLIQKFPGSSIDDIGDYGEEI